jgi:hypothetical protein
MSPRDRDVQQAESCVRAAVDFLRQAFDLYITIREHGIEEGEIEDATVQAANAAVCEVTANLLMDFNDEWTPLCPDCQAKQDDRAYHEEKED